MYYYEYWGLKAAPFANDHRAEFFVPVPSAMVALARLRHALAAEQGLALLTGSEGSGKTELARRLLDDFAGAGWTVAYLPRPDMTAGDLLRRLAPGAGRALTPDQSPLGALETFAVAAHARGGRFLVVVDDAHTVASPAALENFRAWLNIENGGRNVFNLLLAGQPPLEKLLREASGFDRRAAARAVVLPYTPSETRSYIAVRLKRAGGARGLFTRQAADAVARLSSGRPRQINRLGDLALIAGYGLGAKRVEARLVAQAAVDLGLVSEPGYLAEYGEPPAASAAALPGDADILAALAAETA